MPKKHDPKKREREKKGVTMSQKKEKKDRDDSREKSHYLKECPYTCTL